VPKTDLLLDLLELLNKLLVLGLIGLRELDDGAELSKQAQEVESLSGLEVSLRVN